MLPPRPHDDDEHYGDADYDDCDCDYGADDYVDGSEEKFQLKTIVPLNPYQQLRVL